MDAISTLRRLIAEASHVLVIGHASPDGDCVGALLALGVALERLGKAHSLVLPDAIPASLTFVSRDTEVIIAPTTLPNADLIIVPDCSDLGRLGPLNEANSAFLDSVPIVNIDHHTSNAHFGTLNFIDPSSAAVCEQLYSILRDLGVRIDQTLATYLLTGIVTDTQAFRTPSVTTNTMRVATQLVEAGAPLREISDSVYNRRQVPGLRLWAFALSQIEELNGIVWTRMNEAMLAESGATWEESEQLVSLLASVETADIAILFKEMPDGSVRVSLRSDGHVDVAGIARHFGGGGHRGAAGCTIQGTFEEARRSVVDRANLAKTGALV